MNWKKKLFSIILVLAILFEDKLNFTVECITMPLNKKITLFTLLLLYNFVFVQMKYHIQTYCIMPLKIEDDNLNKSKAQQTSRTNQRYTDYFIDHTVLGQVKKVKKPPCRTCSSLCQGSAELEFPEGIKSTFE